MNTEKEINDISEDPNFEHIESLKKQNENLKKKLNKKEKWIEKDEKLAAKPRKSRLVTYNDLWIKDKKTGEDVPNQAFIEKYPKARIGDEICDPEPLLWKLGMKRAPTMEEKHAQIAAQFARDLRDDIEGGETELLTDFDDTEGNFTEAEVTAFLHASSRMDAIAAQKRADESEKEALPPPAEQSEANGGEATAKQTPKKDEGE